MPGKILVPHHSLTDWDFEADEAYRSLDTSFYISPPSSLRHVGGYPWESACTLCRHPDTLCLPQGEVRTWWRSNDTYDNGVTFRNQAPLGSATINNSYWTYQQPGAIWVRRTVLGVHTLLAQLPYATPANTWYHLRVFYYNGYTPGEVPALCIDVYMEEDGEWVKVGDTVYDTLNKWKDSEINRAGLMAWFTSTHRRWFDDTEIWGPV